MPVITSSILHPDRPVLPEWTRWAWSSMIEREYWKPLFERLNGLRSQIEWLTLVEDVRPVIYQHIQPQDLIKKTQEAAEHGFIVRPIGMVSRTDGYTSGSTPTDPTKPWDYRVLIGRQKFLPRVLDTPDIVTNDAVLGDLLGYPACCRDFFLRTWGAGQVDTTWDQYAETGSATGPVEANILWRWMGIRWVSHLPCSFQCEATVEIGKQTREVMKKHGLVEEAKIMDMILSWPVRWSGVNGIAEIVGPCLKVSTRTDWAPPTDQRRFERTGRYVKPTADIWKQNGFSTYQGMLDAHAPIIKELITLIPENGAMIDLGCGNGRLARTVKLHRMDISIGGVDINSEAITAVQTFGIGRWESTPIQELTWTDWFDTDSTVLVYSPVRLTELSEEEAQKTREFLLKYRTHLVYVYGDNLQKQPLPKWVDDIGLPVDKLLMICKDTETNVGLGILRLQ